MGGGGLKKGIFLRYEMRGIKIYVIWPSESVFDETEEPRLNSKLWSKFI